MANNSGKIIFLLDLFIALELISLIGLIFYFQPWASKAQLLSPAEIIEENETITILLVGDIILNRGVEYMVGKKGGGDFKWPFLKIAKYLNKADLVFGNLEGPISDKGIKVGSIYSFRAEPKSIEGLTYAGFDILSLANNHAFDYGREALEDTFLRLKAVEIDYVGVNFPLIKEINGSTGSPPTRIAFLAYTNLGSPYWGINWADWNNLEEIKKDIEEIKNKADVLIVSLHAGEEYSFEPNQFQIDFSKAAIEAGADLIVGHHPHVIQKSEKYKNGYIFYSLGNFVFDQGFSEETMKGLLLEVIIKDKEIEKINLKEIKINEYFQPEIEMYGKI